MFVGDLVRTFPYQELWPTLEGGWRNTIRLTESQVGVVIETREHWGETWVKVVVPGGIGWARPAWLIENP